MMDILSSCLSLATVNFTADSFSILVDCFLSTGWLLTPSLINLDVCAGYLDRFDWNNKQKLYYTEGICKVLQCCSTTLQHLHLWTDDTLPVAAQILELPSLVEYIGPQDFLHGLRMTSVVWTIWVPAPIGNSSVPWSLTQCFERQLGGVNLRHLSVLQWSKSDISVKVLFSLFSRLEEILMEPTSPVSKSRLLALKGPIAKLRHLRSVSILHVSKKHSLSLEEKEAVAKTWRKVHSTLRYVRLDWWTKLVWKEGVDVWYPRPYTTATSVGTGPAVVIPTLPRSYLDSFIIKKAPPVPQGQGIPGTFVEVGLQQTPLCQAGPNNKARVEGRQAGVDFKTVCDGTASDTQIEE
ncbi:hypothetical protein PM082_024962 [Marasmius tenuissimus]|nr:hypothetical protein PM082_024962 [Marasmius tenuissimus]